MASSSSYHTRSNSLPSHSNLISSQFDEQISRIRSSESASSSSSEFTHLNNLYDYVEEFLQLPSTQKSLYSQRQEKSVESLLEGSIKFLDACSSITDVCSQMKEHAQQLQSMLRRRCSEDEISKEVAKYLKSKKAAMKAVSKALKELKKMENSENTDMISKCQTATLKVLESILVSMAGEKANSKWESVKSKLMKAKSNNKFFVGSEAMDAHPEKMRSQFGNMEMNIKDVEQGVESLFRHLIKTRTSILNILNF